MSFDHLDDILLAPNPITDAKIVGDGIAGETYMAQADGAKRGQPNYVMSGSDLAEFSNCPKRWFDGYADGESTATEWGSVLDCLLMDGIDAVLNRFCMLPEKYPSKDGDKDWTFAATYCKDWRKEHNPGCAKTEIKAKIWAEVQNAAHVIFDQPELKELFASSRKQVMITGIFDDKETGIRVPVKSLLDLVPPVEAGYLVDFKTTRNAHPRAWKKDVAVYGYHCQAARHLDLWNAATGEQRNDFRHILQESYEPFQTAKRFLSSEFLAIGRREYIGALKRYASCLKASELGLAGAWPDYDQPVGANNEIVIDGWLMVAPEAWMI